MTAARWLVSVGAAVIVVAATASIAHAAAIKVACVGASTTSGDGSSAGHHFPDELGIALGPGYDVMNFGVSGTTMLKTGDDPYWNHPQLQQALAFQPDIAVLWFGGNDAKPQNWTGHMAEFITDYEAMVHAFQALSTQPRIYLMLSMVTHDTEGIPKAVLEQQVLPEVRQVGADTGSILINYHDAFIGYPQFFPDGIHPNDAGTAAIGRFVAEILVDTTPGARVTDAGFWDDASVLSFVVSSDAKSSGTASDASAEDSAVDGPAPGTSAEDASASGADAAASGGAGGGNASGASSLSATPPASGGSGPTSSGAIAAAGRTPVASGSPAVAATPRGHGCSAAGAPRAWGSERLLFLLLASAALTFRRARVPRRQRPAASARSTRARSVGRPRVSRAVVATEIR
jgi:lysophospholipase L1-like esterase